MWLIEWYALFAVTTSLVAGYELFWPVLKSLSITHPELQVVQTTWLTMLVFMTMALVLAPLTILPCVWPASGERFRKKLWETLLKD
jgi:membrane-anchored protein YejM (alkaline phosphatase superfamily)